MDPLNMDKFINELKDSVICDLTEILKKLTIEIDRYYIRRTEHDKIIKELKEEHANEKVKYFSFEDILTLLQQRTFLEQLNEEQLSTIQYTLSNIRSIKWKKMMKI